MTATLRHMHDWLSTIRNALPDSTTRPEMVAAWDALEALRLALHDLERTPHEPSPDGPSEAAVEAAWKVWRESSRWNENDEGNFASALRAAYAVDRVASRGATGEGR